MSAIAGLLVVLGFGLMLLGFVFFLLHAFRTSILWGLGVLFFPLVQLLFLIVHWDRAKNAFFLQLWGIGFILVAALALQAKLPWPLN